VPHGYERLVPPAARLVAARQAAESREQWLIRLRGRARERERLRLHAELSLLD
jgi:hypothetical protein